MAEQFYTILTNVGKAKIANALPTGTKVNLTKMKIGDSNGTYYNPSESQTELVHKVYECNVTSVEVDESNPNWITITAAIPSDVGGFSIREVGVFDDSNSLIAIGKYPETYKPVASDGSVKELYIKMTLEVVNASSVELKIDPTIILATKKDIANINTKVEDVTTQLDNIVNKVSVRRLKPAFGTSVFWADISANGDTYIPTDEQIINEIKSIEEMQVDTIIGSVHIGYKDGNLFLAENLSHLLPIVKTNLKNVKMTALKIHITRISKATITEMGETFKTQYKNLVSSILDNFKMFDTIKYVYHLNEMDWMYKDNNYHQFISELNTIVRSRGYKAGITNAGFYNIKFTPDVVYNSIDVIGINHYPALSFSGKEITKEEALNAWRNDNALGFCKELKKQFPNMEITITESGVMDYWIALSRPSYYSWTTEQKIATGGKAPNVYLWGLLNSLNDDVVSNIWWLFDLNYPNETNNTINYFLRGGELNNDNIK